MYKWAVTIYLKSGAVLKGLTKCDEDNSTDLFNGLMTGYKPAYTAINTEDGNGALFFSISDVSAMELKPLEGERVDEMHILRRRKYKLFNILQK